MVGLFCDTINGCTHWDGYIHVYIINRLVLGLYINRINILLLIHVLFMLLVDVFSKYIDVHWCRLWSKWVPRVWVFVRLYINQLIIMLAAGKINECTLIFIFIPTNPPCPAKPRLLTVHRRTIDHEPTRKHERVCETPQLGHLKCCRKQNKKERK